MQLLEHIIAAIAPHECCGCGAEGAVLCAGCVQFLPAMPGRCYRCGRLDATNRTCASCRRSSALRSVWAATAYDGLGKEIIGRLKFGRARAAAQDIARAMASSLDSLDIEAGATIVTHVPTANKRVRERGYDQAALIAKELAALLNAPYAPLLARVGTVRQLGAGRQRRRAQLQHAFRPLRPYLYQNRSVLLVDDVITTGSTLEAAAVTLKAAGAKTVHAAVFARA